VGNHHGQEAGLKCGFDSSKNNWTFGSESLLCQELRKRPEETVWKREKLETSLANVIFMSRVLTYVISYKLFWLIVLCNLYRARFDLAEGLLFDTFFIFIFVQIVSL